MLPVSLSRLNHSPNVNQYLALSFRQLAMGSEQTSELTDLEDAMDELWDRLLDVERDEVNEIVSKAFRSIRADTEATGLHGPG